MASLIALDSELVTTLQATLEAARLELHKVQQLGRKDEPMTIKEASAYLKISRQTLASYADSGVITPSEYGNRVWYMRSELDSFLKRHQRRKAAK